MAGGNLFTAEEDATIRETHRVHAGARGWAAEAARKIGRSRQAVADRFHVLSRKAEQAQSSDEPTGAAGFAQDGDTATVEWEPSPRVLTLAQLLKTAAVDQSVWDVERFVVNKWEVGTKHPKTGEVTIAPLFQVKAWLRKKPSQLASTLFANLLDDIRAERKRPPAPLYTQRKRPSSGYLFEFTPFDLHMGKFAWGDETVANYDVDIAEDLFRASLDSLLARALAVSGGSLDRVLCVFGNDVSHVDSKKQETTAGTPMDYDSRYIRVYRRICAVHREAITKLRDVAPVDVKIVPGNHDELTSFHLGEFLSAYFHHDKHVAIDNGPKLRKYYDYGVNLFGFAHGDSEKVSELPLLMAREVPDLWAKCPSREWHIGHKHIEEKWESKSSRKTEATMGQDLFSDKGIRVRRLASLSAHDAWHTKHAYTDRRACDSFVFHREAGFDSHLSFNVDHFTGQPMTPKKGRAA